MMATDWSPRAWLRGYYSRAAHRPLVDSNEAHLPRTALVFSPHQDDETLGCGGTIIRKVEAGAQVTIVFMTDGRQSHGHIIPASELTVIRKREAFAACRVLGVADKNVIFLDFEDGHLADFQDKAINLVADILAQVQPEEIYVPYFNESPPDHVATNRIVLAALAAQKVQASIYEYPVWFWHHWPWVRVRQGGPRATREVLKTTLNSQLGFRLLKDFNHAIFVGDVLNRKREALDQHRSQMTQLLPDSRWLTLHDVAGGEFLACFFQDYELFRHYQQDQPL